MEREIKAAKVGELQDGQMKEVAVGELKILLLRLKGKLYALGGECPHYGGPLAEGALSGERVVCPWHQAAFDVHTGDLLEPPALQGLTRFTVRVEEGDVIVTVPDQASASRPMPMARHNPAKDGRTFVILGAGAAGNVAAETLRQVGYEGRLMMISKETRLPYDRPNLSKGYLAGLAPPESLPWRSAEFYQEHDIELHLGREVVKVDAGTQAVTLADGDTLTYDQLLVATGGTARRLGVPGEDLANVFTLRSADDSDRIIAACEGASRAVVVGGSFISLEAAASLTKRGLAVTVVAPGAVPFARTLGPEIGRMWQTLHEENGVTFKMNARLGRFEGEGRVQAAVLDSGERLPADLVVAGVGIAPATQFLEGVPLNADGSLTVDTHLRAAEHLYAAGDIVRFPHWRTGELIRVEHWRLAEQHGRVAAQNMAGQETPYRGVPFFWTDQFDVYLYYVGHASDWDEIIYHGDPAGRKFLAFYVKGEEVLAAAGVEHDGEMAAIGELLRLGRMPSVKEIRKGEVDWLSRL